MKRGLNTSCSSSFFTHQRPQVVIVKYGRLLLLLLFYLNTNLPYHPLPPPGHRTAAWLLP